MGELKGIRTILDFDSNNYYIDELQAAVVSWIKEFYLTPDWTSFEEYGLVGHPKADDIKFWLKKFDLKEEDLQ